MNRQYRLKDRPDRTPFDLWFVMYVNRHEKIKRHRLPERRPRHIGRVKLVGNVDNAGTDLIGFFTPVHFRVRFYCSIYLLQRNTKRHRYEI